MATAAGGELPVAVRARRVREALEASRGYEAAESAGGTGSLAVQVVKELIRPPFHYVPDAIAEASNAIRHCLIPYLISHAAFVVGIGIITFGNTLIDIGAADRGAGAFWLIWSREIGTWVTEMIVAALVGSAITADLGARRIREELDALAVLGVDQIRSLVVPRVAAVTLISPVLTFVSLLWINLLDYLIMPTQFGVSHGVILSNLSGTIVPLDLLGPMLIKNTVIGFFIGIVACQKGLSCKLGAEGVGRATAQTVVITYFGIWAFNLTFRTSRSLFAPPLLGVLGGVDRERFERGDELA